MNDNAQLRDRVEALERLLRAIIDNASPCTTACCVVVEESLINEARELLEKSHE